MPSVTAIVRGRSKSAKEVRIKAHTTDRSRDETFASIPSKSEPGAFESPPCEPLFNAKHSRLVKKMTEEQGTRVEKEETKKKDLIRTTSEIVSKRSEVRRDPSRRAERESSERKRRSGSAPSGLMRRE